MPTLLALALLLLPAGLARAEPDDMLPAAIPVDLELFLAVDASGSIDEEEAKLQRQGFVDAFYDADVLAAIQGGIHGRIAITYVEWAGRGTLNVIMPWTLVAGPWETRRVAAQISVAPRTSGVMTSISSVIEYAVPSFATNGFVGERQVIDISGDGPNNTGALVSAARDMAVSHGITINGLPIMNGRPNPSGAQAMPNLDHYYADCVIGGPGSFIVVARDFDDFSRAIKHKMFLEIAGLRPAPARAWTGWVPRYERPIRPVRAAMPCDIGEQQLYQYMRWMNDF